MPASVATVQRVKSVLRSCLKLDEDAVITDDMPLMGGEYDIDSLDVLLIITTIEKEFGVQIREGTMDRKAFASIQTLADHVDLIGPTK